MINGLTLDRDKFWKLYERNFGIYGAITDGTRKGLDFILDRFETEKRLKTVPQFAYVLATAFHESGKVVLFGGKKVMQRFVPVKEGKASKSSDVWKKYQSKYWDSGFYGRGLIQTTWEDKYLLVGKRLGVGRQFVESPDDLLEPKWAYEALVMGMTEGIYRTLLGVKQTLALYLPDTLNDATPTQYYRARDIVNGDKDIKHDPNAPVTNGVHVANIAERFEGILFSSMETPQPAPIAEPVAVSNPENGQTPESEPLTGLEDDSQIAENEPPAEPTTTQVSVEGNKVEVKTSEGAQEPSKPVVIEKPAPRDFKAVIEEKLKKLTGANTLYQIFEAIYSKAQEYFTWLQTIGLTTDVIVKIGYILLGASIAYLIVLFFHNRQQEQRDKELTDFLTKANTTPDNTVMYLHRAEIDNLDPDKFTIVYR